MFLNMARSKQLFRQIVLEHRAQKALHEVGAKILLVLNIVLSDCTDRKCPLAAENRVQLSIVIEKSPEMLRLQSINAEMCFYLVYFF